MNSSDILHKSISIGDLDTVRSLLVRDPAMIRGHHLFAAAEAGQSEVVRYLVEYSRISLDERDENGRDVLHYAAESDDAGLWDYLIRKCGMDPLRGDRDLITPWESAVSSGSNSICRYMTERYGNIEDYYKNPIRTGMFPDPSIVRVGEDYYMVNSTFIFFPCIPVSRSRDLINWEIIGYAITNPEWAHLDELEGGRGYWAPDISYYDGRFYITATMRFNDDTGSLGITPYRRQIVVSSDRPEGPYSEPAYIDEDGIDPSIFNDDDGRRYMLLNRGARILELDETGTRQISEAKLLYYGDRKRAPEGPHLYKKDGYYYLILAEGGTGPGHMVTVQRSKTLFGDYEPSPYNPIMRQNDPAAAIQRCGHGDLVDTPDGRWYMVYLCGRMLDGKYSMLGRETALDPVTWTADGWPIVNDLRGPSALQRKPFLQMDHGNGSARPADSAPMPGGLPSVFMTPRPPAPGTITVQADRDGGYEFVLTPSSSPMSSTGCRSIVLRRQTAFKCRVSVVVTVPGVFPEGMEFGLTGYYDENTYCVFGLTKRNGQIVLRTGEHIGDEDTEFIADAADMPELLTPGAAVPLEMRTDGLKRAFYCGEKLIHTLPDVYYLCDEGIKKGKRFTGAMAGIYAVCSDRADKIPPVRFTEFGYVLG